VENSNTANNINDLESVYSILVPMLSLPGKLPEMASPTTLEVVDAFKAVSLIALELNDELMMAKSAAKYIQPASVHVSNESQQKLEYRIKSVSALLDQLSAMASSMCIALLPNGQADGLPESHPTTCCAAGWGRSARWSICTRAC